MIRLNLQSNKKISFFLNGKKYHVNKKISIRNIINYFNYNSSIFIIEHNNLICNKKNWSKRMIKNNDKIEIVSIVGGG